MGELGQESNSEHSSLILLQQMRRLILYSGSYALPRQPVLVESGQNDYGLVFAPLDTGSNNNNGSNNNSYIARLASDSLKRLHFFFNIHVARRQMFIYQNTPAGTHTHTHTHTHTIHPQPTPTHTQSTNTTQNVGGPSTAAAASSPHQAPTPTPHADHALTPLTTIEN